MRLLKTEGRDVDDALLTWLQQEGSDNVPVIGPHFYDNFCSSYIFIFNVFLV
jgi:hypothetical protein